METNPTVVGAPVTAARQAVQSAWFFAIAFAVVAADQATKWGIRGWLDQGDRWPEGWPVRLIHVTNSGAAFGMFQGAGFLLAIASVVGVTAILIYLFNPGFAHPLLRLGLAFMLGGAAGNLIDRIRDGEVVDFIKVPHWPAFNVADSSITIGVVLLLWVMVSEPRTQNVEN